MDKFSLFLQFIWLFSPLIFMLLTSLSMGVAENPLSWCIFLGLIPALYYTARNYLRAGLSDTVKSVAKHFAVA
jgi:hypothetical protein